MVSRKIGRSSIGRDIKAALGEIQTPILAAGTTQRIIYAEALTAGLTVMNSQPRGLEAAEVRTLLSEILQVMI